MASSISKHPATWPAAVPLTAHCGACQIQAMLAATEVHKHVDELYRTRLHRDGFGTGVEWDHTYTMPWDITHILGKHGIKTKTHLGRGKSLLPVALASFERGHPLIVQIRSTMDGGLHWISLWSFDDTRGKLLAYDSQSPTREGGVGNTEFTPAFLHGRLPLGFLWAIEIVL